MKWHFLKKTLGTSKRLNFECSRKNLELLDQRYGKVREFMAEFC